ncbi:MAG: AMP-binding protein [Actinomycetota bacterium]|nr:AMP-binding protein [Actinomycetota bacterium]
MTALRPAGDRPVGAPSADVSAGTGNVADLVRAAARTAPDRTAFTMPAGSSLSWRELDERVDGVARGLGRLGRLGLAPGDRVALQLDNTLDFPVAWFAVLRAGLVAVPVNAGLPALEHVVVAGAAAPGGLALDELARTDGPPVDTTRGGDDLAAVLYTAGTSGRARGAMLSHRALLANLEQTSSLQPPVATPDDVVLLVLPLSHVYGLNAALDVVARTAATGVLVERFDPVETAEVVRRAGVTVVPGAPPVYVAWSMLPDVREALSGVRLFLSGAAPLAPEVQQRFRSATGHDVHEGYGLTETAPVLATTLVSGTAKPGSVGRPLPGVELRLRDESGAPAEDGDPGEIVVRGPNVFSGYWPDGADGPDADGWYATGDVAYADADGDLHLVDRRRELVLVSGFNVYPREVEVVLLRHPDVAEAAVLGIPHPYTGESVKALVVPRPGAQPSAEELIEHCATSLARFKCPTAVELVAELPRTATGKVSKARLRESGV